MKGLPVRILIFLGAFSASVHAFNWAWDQGHDVCVVNPTTGEHGYVDGRTLQWVPDPCCPCTKCNVYSLTGVYFESATDISLPGQGPGLALSRTWNSSDPASGLLGHGWTLNLGRNLLSVSGKDGAEYLILRRDNGQELKLRRSGNAYEFTTAMQFDFRVEKSGNGWRVTEEDGSTSEYNPDGKLVRITDRNGLSLQLEYDVPSGCLRKAVNASGNSLEFTLNPNGKIATVADNFGRTVNYTYDGSDNLTQADYWDGSSAKYGYGTANLLTRVYNRRGQVFREVVYNQQRKVIELKEKGETAHFSYDFAKRTVTKTDSKGRVWKVTTDENGINVLEVDPLGHTIRRQPSKVAGPRNFEWVEDQNGNRTTFGYNSAGDMTSRTDPLGNSERWTYNTAHQPVSYTDAMGVVTRYEYDARGSLTRKIEAAGTADARTWEYAYDARGNMLSEKNPLGATTTHEYDSQGNKTKQAGPKGETTSWAYDSLGRMKTRTDAVGGVWSYAYDERGNRVREIDPLRGVSQKEYDADGNMSAETDALGNRTAYEHDAWNRLTLRAGPKRDSTFNEWIVIGDETYVSGIRDAVGHWTYFEYDDAGRKTAEIVKMENALRVPGPGDRVTRIVYDKAGNILKIRNPAGDTTGFTYDRANRPIRTCNGEGECSATEYDSNARILRVTQPNGNILRYQYDNLGKEIRSLDNLGVVGEKRYDKNGFVVWNRVPGLGAVFYEYDDAGRLVRQRDSTGVGRRFEYDAAGNLVSEADSAGRRTVYGYDIGGRQIWVRNANGDTTHYQCDALGRQTAIIDPDGNRSEFIYDPYGRRLVLTYPGGHAETRAYDKAGRLVSKRAPGGTVTTYGYDWAGGLRVKAYSTGATPDSFAYDAAGRMVYAGNGTARLSWTYDKCGRPTAYFQAMGNAIYRIGYGYDASNNTATVEYPGGRRAAKVYNARGLLERVVLDGTLPVVAYGYSGMAVTSKTFGNGVSAAFSHDASGRITRLAYFNGGTELFESRIGYDSDGNKVFERKDHEPSASETYGYDNLGQLIEFKRGIMDGNQAIPSPSHFQRWVIDSRGNWTQFNDNGAIQNRTHNAVNEVMTANDSPLAYDPDGNLVSEGGHAYQWNAKNELVKADGNAFGYDALGRRVAKVLLGGAVADIVYDNWQAIEEHWNDGALKTYVYGAYLDEPIVRVSAQGGIGDTLYFHANTQYSVSLLSGALGNVLERREYLPYGSYNAMDGQGQPLGASLSGLSFQGRESEPGLPIFNFRNRYYHSGLGAFASRDPIENQADLSLYAFVRNSPVNSLDPFGLTTIGQILDAFFSLSTTERMWVMGESDGYTARVRRWQPVIGAVDAAKADLEANCNGWKQSHMTTSGWTPGRTDPPVPDPNAWGTWVNSPPGTDPVTARNAFIVYQTTGYQTDALYTSAIGSFGIYVTADELDCPCKKSKLNIWMANAMDRDSFGRFARHWFFRWRGMARQYMWWNWKEQHDWGGNP